MTSKRQTHNIGTKRIKIVVVDDHPIVRQGLAAIINQEDDLELCGEAEHAFGAMSLVRKFQPDLMIVDISLKESNGLELVKSVKSQNPSPAVLVLSIHDESLYAECAFRAGADGYLMKEDAVNHIIDAIRQILDGRIYASDIMASRMLRKISHQKKDVGVSVVDLLSNRELEVFILIGKGYKAKAIADRLCLSVKTIETHCEHIKQKLNLENASALLRYAIEWGRNNNTQ